MPRGQYDRSARAGSTKPQAQEVRKEIFYCRQCAAQLADDQVHVIHDDVVMTSFGGITTTRITCRAHPEELVQVATHFVVKARSKTEASGLS
jgi:hypothetical protein